ncbi:MAG: hypothetical protein Q8P20_05585 [bacterium]|nr:hypothetical protein [bacterium]
MKAKILDILTEVQKGTKTPISAQKELLDLFGVMPRFIVTYKNDGFEKELYWETSAKTDVDAVDLFWKTHDVMCELVSVNEA